MRHLLFIFILVSVTASAQDNVFLKNGKKLSGNVVSVSNEIVYFRLYDTSALQQLKKADVLMIDASRGRRYIFGKQSAPKEKTISTTIFTRNSFGMQPIDIFTGRITFVYERLNKAGNIGFALPFSLTFDPVGTLIRQDSSQQTERIPGVKFITGLDVNFYLVDKEYSRLFAGPRIRYGTDMFLGNVEAYTIQSQVGYRFGEPANKFSQHLSVGVGVAGILTPPAGATVPNGQFFSWFSFNYRLGFNW
jgi:hypothetical protein